MDVRVREVSSGTGGQDLGGIVNELNRARGAACENGFSNRCGQHGELEDGAEGQNRTGYAGLFRAALYQ
jgi:hypothetical protein